MEKSVKPQDLTATGLKYRISEFLAKLPAELRPKVNRKVEKDTGKNGPQLSRYRNLKRTDRQEAPVRVLMAYKEALYLNSIDELINA